MISRSNYEIYFVDFFDGRLDEKAKTDLFAFLNSNSDLRDEFEQFEEIVSKPEKKIVYGNKDGLKKDTSTLLNYKTWLIAELENDLNKDQIKTLDAFCKKHLEIQSERKMMPFIKLKAGQEIFSGKSSLKKGGTIISFKRSTLIRISAAAAIVIFILGYLFLNENKRNERIYTEDKFQPANESHNKVAEIPDTQIDSVITTNEKHVVDSKNNSEKHSPLKIHSNKNANEQLFTQAPEENKVTRDTSSAIAPAPYENPVATHEEKVTSKKESTQQPNITLADILDDDDMKELNANTENTDNSLPAIAMKEVERISGLSIKKDKGATSMTYALSVNRVFSIKHTVRK